MGSYSTYLKGTNPLNWLEKGLMELLYLQWIMQPKKKVGSSLKIILILNIVAIKKLGKIDDMIDAKRVLREIKIMKNL